MARIKLTSIQMKLVIAVSVVALLLVGVLVWRQINQESAQNTTQINDGLELSQHLTQIQVHAYDYLNDGDVDGGLNFYDDQISKWQNDSDKRSLLVSKSGFAVEAEQFDVAIDSAQQADEISSDATSIEALARAYEYSGDKERALVYYRELLGIQKTEDSGTSQEGPPFGRPAPSIEYKIEELEK